MVTLALTGSDGFIGKNLFKALSGLDNINIRCFDKSSSASLEEVVKGADIIYHLAGVNRPDNPADFSMNIELTRDIINFSMQSPLNPTIVFSSSAQVALDNPYGRSKKAAEELLVNYHRETGASVYIYRLPGVFGKWSRPNYNTVVATFCYNIARNMEISISDPDRELELVYIDDVVENLISVMQNNKVSYIKWPAVVPLYRITLEKLANTLYEFQSRGESLNMEDLPDNLTKCLYATYRSFLPIN